MKPRSAGRFTRRLRMGRKYGGNLTRQFGLYVLRVLEPMRLTMDIESHIGLQRIGPVIVMYSVFVNYGDILFAF